MTEDVFVGRQPICKERAEVFGYELLCRDNQLVRTALNVEDHAAAAADVKTSIGMGLEKLAGKDLAFVGIDRDFLLGGFCSSLPRDRVVLEVPGDAVMDSAFVDSVAKLSNDGYAIALDNYESAEQIGPIAQFTDIAKIDVRSVNYEEVVRRFISLRQSDVKLLAENVETREDYEFCRKLGFDYYQGFFFCKPDVATHKKIPFNRLSTIHLLAKLQDPNISTQDLERAVAQNLAITYKVLRYLNSSYLALPRKIESIRHAVVLVGTRLLSNWASLAMLESIEDKPREVMVTAMVRAHMCQQLGTALRQRNVDQFFTVGLLSVIDALLDRPIREALLVLPLADNVKHALIEHEGLMGTALECVNAYERADWDNAKCPGLDDKAIRDAYLSSVVATRSMMQAFMN
jgi:EAL and modified HD-GYP domain-containing signal transduction protein